MWDHDAALTSLWEIEDLMVFFKGSFPSSPPPPLIVISETNSHLNAGVVIFIGETPSIGNVGPNPDEAISERQRRIGALLESTEFSQQEYTDPHLLRQDKWLRDVFCGTPLQSILPKMGSDYILLWAHIGELMNKTVVPLKATCKIDEWGQQNWSWKFTRGASTASLSTAKLVKGVHEWGGAAFEQGALSVLLWLSTEKYPVATLPGHLGFMHIFLPLPTAAWGSLNQNYTDQNLIVPPLIVHGMGENCKIALANLQQIQHWSSFLHSLFGFAHCAAPCYEQTGGDGLTELVLGPGIRALYNQCDLPRGSRNGFQRFALRHLSQYTRRTNMVMTTSFARQCSAFCAKGINHPAMHRVLLPHPDILRRLHESFGVKMEPQHPRDITIHCPGLGSALDLGEYDIVIANKGALAAQRPSLATRDQEVFANGSKTTKVAYAPTQIGQAMKAMFRDPSFRDMWRALLLAQQFPPAVIAKLDRSLDQDPKSVPVPAHLMPPDKGVRMALQILMTRAIHPAADAQRPSRFDITGFSAGSYTAALLAHLIVTLPVHNREVTLKMVRIGGLAMPPDVLRPLLAYAVAYALHIDSDQLCRVEPVAPAKAFHISLGLATLTLLGTHTDDSFLRQELKYELVSAHHRYEHLVRILELLVHSTAAEPVIN